MSRTMMLTGCASGIGKHLANALFEEGHNLLLTDANEAGLNAVAEAHGWLGKSRVEIRALDVRDVDAWEQTVAEAVKKWQRLDVLFNVAGYLSAVWAHQATREDVHRTVDVNVKGVMFGTNVALRTMIQQGSGHIVNVASMAGIVPVPGIAIYSASKHAARAYSIAVGQEARRYEVFVTAVCPTVVDTPMMEVQVDREEAAFTFSGKRALSVGEVTHAIVHRALVDKPLELVLPVPGTPQAVLAKIANAFPELGARFGDRIARIGRLNQQRLRGPR